jgi:3-hydroxy-9,10-secoandrosta-1,3,5(10)-triene-9,17-dione monooxygenase
MNINLTTAERVIPTDEDVVARATALIPKLRERLFATQKLGRIPEETIADFERAGFFRILQPKLFGGYEKSPLTFYRVLQEIASGCPSSGWVLMVLGIHNWEAALLDVQAAKDLWEKNDAVRISSSYAPFGGGVKVDGGYQVKGRWKFSSGCDHATWVFLGGYVPTGEDAPPDFRVFLIPRGDYEIIDGTWDVFGLEGTGSKDVEVKGCFVPAYRSHSLMEHFTSHGNDPGLKTFTNPYYRIPFGVAFHNGVASVVTGMAKGMVQLFAEQMQARRNNITGELLSVNVAVQRRIQIADSKARQASNLIRSVVERCESYLNKGEAIPLDKRAQFVGDAATAGELASEASVLLFRAAGGKGVYSDNLLGAFFRNIQAGCNHICMDLDKLGVNAGGTLLGLPNQYPIT